MESSAVFVDVFVPQIAVFSLTTFGRCMQGKGNRRGFGDPWSPVYFFNDDGP